MKFLLCNNGSLSAGRCVSLGLAAVAITTIACEAPSPPLDYAAIGNLAQAQQQTQQLVLEVELAQDDPTGGDFLASDPGLQAVYQEFGSPVAVAMAAPGFGPTRQQMEDTTLAVRAQFSQRSMRSSYGQLSDAEFAAKIPDIQRFYVMEFAANATAAAAPEALVQALLAADGIAWAQQAQPAGWDDLDEDEIDPPLGGGSGDGSPGCTPDDPAYCDGRQPYLTAVDAEGAWALSTGSSTFIAAVLDKPLCHTHQDFAAQLEPGFNAATLGPAASSCTGSHGDHVAGVIAARTNNTQDMAAFNWNSRIMPATVSTTSKVAAITEAVKRGASAMNLSWNVAASDKAVAAAADLAWSLGVPLVVAAGNAGREGLISRASSTMFIAGGEQTQSRNFGLGVDIHAPSENILSLYGRGNLGTGPSQLAQLSGTSMAAPMVTGTLGLLFALDPLLTIEQARQAIRRRGTDIGEPNWDTTYGWGFLNTGAAASWAYIPSPPTYVRMPPCEARISQPTMETVLYGDPFNVTGTVQGPMFAHYVLTLDEGLPGASHATTVAASYGGGPVVDDILTPASFTPTGSGAHTLVLRAYNSSGVLCGDDRAVVFVAPEAKSPKRLIDSSLAYSIVNGGVFAKAEAGDVTGDGIDDLLVAHNRCSTLLCEFHRSSVARQAVVQLLEGGTALAAPGDVDLATTRYAWKDYDSKGVGVSMALADVDGDGLKDVVLGYPRSKDVATETYEPGSVCVYLAANRLSKWHGSMGRTDADYCFESAADGDRLGGTVENVGDMDLDGRDDVAVAACGNDTAGTDAGAVYVLPSATLAGWASSGSIDAVPGITKFVGAEPTTSSCALSYGEVIPVAGVGDLNGDGSNDILIGDPRIGAGAGAAFVHTGPLPYGVTHPWVAADMTLVGGANSTGDRVFAAGDINGDGKDDLVVRSCHRGSHRLTYGNAPEGCGKDNRLDVVLGRPLSSPVSVTLGPGSAAVFKDIDAHDYMGEKVVAGDFNGDGHADLMISSPLYGSATQARGMVWTVYGDGTGLPSGSIRTVAHRSMRPQDHVDSAFIAFTLGLGLELTPGDFDGDGDTEVFTNLSGISDLRGTDTAAPAQAWFIEAY